MFNLFSFANQTDKPLKEGDILPSFALLNEKSERINIGDLIGKKALVIYFYPKDDTPGCTKEACSFRDSFADFKDIGAEVFGISADRPASHRKFIEKYKLPFSLLSDANNYVRDKIFGVKRDILGLLPGRVTYIINLQGKIIKVYDSASGANHHEESLKALKAEIKN